MTVDGADCLAVTETTITATRCLPGTRALEVLMAWAAPFGFDPSCCALDHPIVRDCGRRRIYYPVVDLEAPDLDYIRLDFVQLEAAPPPWPREIRELA